MKNQKIDGYEIVRYLSYSRQHGATECVAPYIYGWHVTERASVDEILSEGLHGGHCASHVGGTPRPYAVYMFDDPALAVANAECLGISDPVVIEVKIPRESGRYADLRSDDLYNMLEVANNGAFRILGDVPAEWLRIA